MLTRSIRNDSRNCLANQKPGNRRNSAECDLKLIRWSTTMNVSSLHLCSQDPSGLIAERVKMQENCSVLHLHPSCQIWQLVHRFIIAHINMGLLKPKMHWTSLLQLLHMHNIILIISTHFRAYTTQMIRTFHRFSCRRNFRATRVRHFETFPQRS